MNQARHNLIDFYRWRYTIEPKLAPVCRKPYKFMGVNNITTLIIIGTDGRFVHKSYIVMLSGIW